MKSYGSTEYIAGYKIILNKNSKEEKYISIKEEKIEDFLNVVERGMDMK